MFFRNTELMQSVNLPLKGENFNANDFLIPGVSEKEV